MAYDVEFCEVISKNLVRPMYDKGMERLFNERLLCVKMQFCIHPIIVPADERGFINRVLSDKPPVNRPSPKRVGNPLKIVVFADAHLDYYYKEGSEVDCGLPLCCRDTYKQIYNIDINVTTSGSGKKAGKWGAIGHCDIPYVITSFNL